MVVRNGYCLDYLNISALIKTIRYHTDTLMGTFSEFANSFLGFSGESHCRYFNGLSLMIKYAKTGQVNLLPESLLRWQSELLCSHKPTPLWWGSCQRLTSPFHLNTEKTNWTGFSAAFSNGSSPTDFSTYIKKRKHVSHKVNLLCSYYIWLLLRPSSTTKLVQDKITGLAWPITKRELSIKTRKS